LFNSQLQLHARSGELFFSLLEFSREKGSVKKDLAAEGNFFKNKQNRENIPNVQSKEKTFSNTFTEKGR